MASDEMTPAKLDDLTEWFLVPLVCSTKRNKYKIVRAGGQIIQFTVLLPWFMAAVYVMMFIDVATGFYELAVEWWRNV